MKDLSKGEKTRIRILEVALNLFVSQGFNATSTRQITDELNMTRSSLYSHFQSKDEIFEEVLARYHPWLQIPEAVKAAEGNSLEDLVRDAGQKLLTSWKEHPDRVRLHFIELIEFNGVHLPQLFKTNFERMTEVLHEVIESRDTLSDISVVTLSRGLLGLFFAYIMTEEFTSGGVKLDLEQSPFDYLADAYLLGIISSSHTEK